MIGHAHGHAQVVKHFADRRLERKKQTKKRNRGGEEVVERKEILHIPHGMLRCDKNVINLFNLIDNRLVCIVTDRGLHTHT